jgi:catechol 2,3-dioxygenase-like lactoylglutathione lyase family enzyme
MPVVDLDRARNFYENILGLTVAMETDDGDI